MPGRLYVVATPIGNLNDMVPRAVTVLQEVDLIAAEDTRHSLRLLQHFNITTPLKAYHDYSSPQVTEGLLQQIVQGKSVALISDAGTPLISDPGYRIVANAREKGIEVVPVPGPCALVVGLSVAGLPTDRFVFEGFLPAKTVARQKQLEALAEETRTLVFYESPHRLRESLADMAGAFGEERRIVLARELTKRFETILDGSLAEVMRRVAEDSNQQKGEFVIMVAGSPGRVDAGVSEESLRVVKLLSQELPPKKAAALASEITGANKKKLYQWLVAQV